MKARSSTYKIIALFIVAILVIPINAFAGDGYYSSPTTFTATKKIEKMVTFMDEYGNVSTETVVKSGKIVATSYTKIMQGDRTAIVYNRGCKFSSSNKKVATVSKKGIIAAKKPGKTKITLTAKGFPELKLKFTVKITKRPASGIIVPD